MEKAYYQTYVDEESKAQLRLVVRAQQAITDRYGERVTIFHPRSYWRRLRNAALRTGITLLERFTGPLYQENIHQEFRLLSADIRATLTKLTGDGLITSWKLNCLKPTTHSLRSASLSFGEITTPAGHVCNLSGAVGNGVGVTTEQTLYPAIGELLERHACVQWGHRRDVVQHELTTARPDVLSIDQWQFFDHAKLPGAAGSLPGAHHPQSCNFIPAIDVVSGQRTHVPAQLVYIFYNLDHPDEPHLWSTNTSGAAAHSSRDQAIYGAVTELIERDAVLTWWYQQKCLATITEDSIVEMLPQLGPYFDSLKHFGVTVQWLDATNELGVPIIISVAHGDWCGVHVSAACNHSVTTALEKVVLDTVRCLQLNIVTDPDLVTAYTAGNFIPTNLDQRKKLWQQPGMQSEISWIKSDSIVTLADMNTKKTGKQTTDINALKDILREHEIPMYIADITTPLTRSYNMHCVKAISPTLTPMFFNEWEKPMLVKRFLGKRDGVSLSTIPHPFI